MRLQPLLAEARAWAATIEPRALSASLRALINALQQTIARPVPEEPDPDDVIAFGITVTVAISIAAVLALVYFWLTGRARLQLCAGAAARGTARRDARSVERDRASARLVGSRAADPEWARSA